jgi:O-antigen ligase
VAWTAFAFGGIYPATLVVPAFACVLLALAYRPGVLTRGPARHVDRYALTALAAALVQLLPIPRAVLEALTPATVRLSSTISLIETAAPLPIAIDVPAAAGAVLLLGGGLLLFVTARQIFDAGGIRTTARAVALSGLALAAIAMAQDATAGGLMYWRWRPLDEAAAPFGPFVNRNHFGTWAIMAVPLCIGYLTAHVSAHHDAPAHATWRRKVVAALDARAALLVAAAVTLIAATAVSLSRSAVIGLVAALLAGGELAWRRGPGTLQRSARPAMVVVALGSIAVFAFVAVLVRVGPEALAGRFAAADLALADRVTIWRDTLPVVRDFWLTGTGVGTYQTAMAVYQRSSPGVLFNQAHNHYLQVAAEGGLLVGVPVALALGAFVAAAWARLREDRSGMFWIRTGAASGLAGVAVQSLWETGLTTPANAALAAVLAAMVTHVPPRYGPAGLR